MIISLFGSIVNHTMEIGSDYWIIGEQTHNALGMGVYLVLIPTYPDF